MTAVGRVESHRVPRLSDVVAALSYALDITEGQPEGHAARTCMIGMRIARELYLTPRQRNALFYGLLLKDLGCSSNAAKGANPISPCAIKSSSRRWRPPPRAR